MRYLIVVEDRAVVDIQNAIDFYDGKKIGLGLRFENSIDLEFVALAINPFYQIRYDKIRCKPIKNFPYNIHFRVNEKTNTVIIYAVICTYRNPEMAWLK